MEETIVGLRGAEQSRNRLCIHGDMATTHTFHHGNSSLHTHTLSHRIDHTIVSVVFNLLREICVHIRIEIDRSIGLQPLMREERARSSLPDAIAMTLMHQFLGDAVLQLLLLHMHIVQGTIVNIHQHVIVEVLPTGCIGDITPIGCIIQVQASVQHITLIIALAIGTRTYGIFEGFIQLSIRETVLTYKLIVCREVERQSASRLCHQAKACTSLIHIVCPITRKRVAEESVGSIIETSHRKCQIVIEPMVMGCFCIAIEVGTNTYFNICTLIIHRVLSIDANQSAFRIDSIKRSLWTTQHIHTVDTIEMAIESRLAHQGNIVDIDTQRGTIHT